jgi:hypothetical protein
VGSLLLARPSPRSPRTCSTPPSRRCSGRSIRAPTSGSRRSTFTNSAPSQPSTPSWWRGACAPLHLCDSPFAGRLPAKRRRQREQQTRGFASTIGGLQALGDTIYSRSGACCAKALGACTARGGCHAPRCAGVCGGRSHGRRERRLLPDGMGLADARLRARHARRRARPRADRARPARARHARAARSSRPGR